MSALTYRRTSLRRCAFAAQLVIGVAFAIMSPWRLGAQTLAYDRTTFLNGFASSSDIWKPNYPDLATTPPNYISQAINLKTLGFPNVDPEKRWSGEVNDVYAFVTANAGRHVFVGHSLGGLVARGLFVDSTKARPQFAGILTMATPFQGTVLADSIYKARNFLLDAQRRINDALEGIRTLASVNAISGTKVYFSDVAHLMEGPVFLTVAIIMAKKTQGKDIDLSAIANLDRVPAIADLQTADTAQARIRASSADVGLQRASVVGYIPLRNAAFRLRQSLKGDDAGYDEAIYERNQGVTAFQLCRVIGYGSIVNARQARKCGFALKVLDRLDDRWGRYVNGSEIRRNGFFIVNVARDVPFDGVVSNERSHYPGVTDPARFLAAEKVNHQNIYTTQAGLRRAVEAMQLFQMERTGTLPAMLGASITGPSSLTTAQTGTWTASATGGTPPYTYQWSGMLTGTGQSIRGTGEGTLYLDAFDATLQHVTRLKRVTLTTGCGTQKAC